MAKKLRDYKSAVEKSDAPQIDLSKAPSFIRKPIEWFKNYWYYYKMYAVILIPMIVVIAVLIISPLKKKTADFTVAVCAGFTVDNEDLEIIRKNLEPYLPDADGDGKLEISMSELLLRDELSDEFYAQNYNKLMQYMVFDEVVFFLTDTYSYEYLKDHGYIEPFSVIGAGDTDEYELLVAELPIFEETVVRPYADWRLLVKTETMTSRNNKVYIARREALASMIKALKAQ